MKIKLTALAATCSLLVSMQAQAQQFGDLYVGASLAYHTLPDAEKELRSDLRGTGIEITAFEDGVSGLSLYGGYSVVEGGAIEIGFLNAADVEVKVRTAGSPGGLTGSVSMSAFYAALVGHFPTADHARFHPFLKAGMANWDSESSVYVNGLQFQENDDGTDPLLGFGIDTPGPYNTSIRGEYILLLIDDDNGGKHHRFQAGLKYIF